MFPQTPRPDFQMESEEGPFWGEVVAVSLEDPTTKNDVFYIYPSGPASEIKEE